MSIFDINNKRIFVAGHQGMVGTAIVEKLKKEDCEILTIPKSEVDLMNQHEVNQWMKKNSPDAVIICAAKVGGILANNSFPAEFIYNNIMIAANLIHASHLTNVEKLVFLGSSCIYPKSISRPITEKDLLTSELESTNQWYAIAKISGIKLCEAYRKQYKRDFISAMPTNLYGPGDTYDPENGHVIPSMILKFLEAKKNEHKSVEIWGTGKVKREFMHVYDCADAIIFLLKNYSDDIQVNIGTGEEVSIYQLANMISEITEYKGQLFFDETKLEGTKRKLLNTRLLESLGWKSKITLRSGLTETINSL